jgi:hypothetical protein
MREPMPERWLPVPGYEGRYEVSDWGRVKSLPRNTTSGGIMKLSPDARGAQVVNLTKSGKQRVHLVHHLVLQAFAGPRPEGTEACHNDGNPANNRLHNLRWDTHLANIGDMIRHGTASWQNQTHCVNGHEYTPETTKLNAQGARICVRCAREKLHAYYEQHPEAYRYVPVAELSPDQLQRRRELARAQRARYRQRRSQKSTELV